MKKLTYEQLIGKLKTRNTHDISVIDTHFSNVAEPILVKCNVCEHKWRPRAASLLYLNSGCPKCHFKILHASVYDNFTSDDFVSKLQIVRPNAELISEYTGIENKVTLQCRTCGYEWQISAKHSLKKYGCPKCSMKVVGAKRSFLCHNKFVDRMKTINPSVKILTPYVRSSEYVKVKCNVCGCEWNAKPNNLLRHRGCPECYKRRHAKKI